MKCDSFYDHCVISESTFDIGPGQPVDCVGQCSAVHREGVFCTDVVLLEILSDKISIIIIENRNQ